MGEGEAGTHGNIPCQRAQVHVSKHANPGTLCSLVLGPHPHKDALARAGPGTLQTPGPACITRRTAHAMSEPRLSPTKLKKDLAEVERDLRRASVTLRAPETIRVPTVGVAVLLDVLADWLLLLIEELSPHPPRRRGDD